MNLTKVLTAAAFACGAVFFGSAQGQIVLYDGTTGAPAFNYNDMTLSTGASSFTVDTPVDIDGVNGRFGGAGIDVAPFVDFENEGAVLRIEFRPLATNAATSFRMILADDDGGDVRDEFQYVASVEAAAPINDGSGFFSLSIPISDGDRAFQQAAFGFTASSDFVEDYGVAQWQIQAAYGAPERLSLEVRRVEIVLPATGFLAEADARIEQHRKADLMVRVVDTAGNPVMGATVDVKMQRHAFQWGSAIQSHRINGSGADDVIYRQKVLENFNSVVYENEHKWPAWEGRFGSTFDQTQSFNALPWIAANDLYLRGHYVSWATMTGNEGFVATAGAPPESTVNLQAELFDHIDEKLPMLEDAVGEWDVINHPIGWGPPTYEEEFGLSFYKDIINHTRTVTSRDLWMNEDNVLGGNRFRQEKETQEEYERIIQYLIDEGAGPDGIGFQGHFIKEYDRDNVAAEDIYASLERFAALVPRLKITELDIDMDEDEVKQAVLMNEYLTTFFSHPAVEGVTMWGFWEGQIWRPTAALYRNDWSEKPALVVYQSLVFGEWWTDESGETTELGELPVRGFKGDYEVTVTVAGASEMREVNLLQNQTLEIIVPLVGDYDQSGKINGDDVDLLFAAYGPVAPETEQFDLDGSGVVDFNDAEVLITQYGQTKPGDLDFDGDVDVLGDGATLVLNLGAVGGVGYSDGDINGDGQVNVLGDAALLISSLVQ